MKTFSASWSSFFALYKYTYLFTYILAQTPRQTDRQTHKEQDATGLRLATTGVCNKTRTDQYLAHLVLNLNKFVICHLGDAIVVVLLGLLRLLYFARHLTLCASRELDQLWDQVIHQRAIHPARTHTHTDTVLQLPFFSALDQLLRQNPCDKWHRYFFYEPCALYVHIQQCQITVGNSLCRIE